MMKMLLQRRAILIGTVALFIFVFPSATFGQRIRIADMSMGPLGASQRGYSVFSAAVARFDVVAADDLKNAGHMEKVLAGMDEGWEAAVSKDGFFGFLYNDRVQMVKELGTYPGKGEFVRTPYGAQFRLAGTRFSLNLVLCHIESSMGQKPKAAEGASLAAVYRYFENQTGNHGITLLFAGGLGDEHEQASRSLVARGDVMALRTNLPRTERRDEGGRMFASTALRSRIEESGISTSTPHAAYVTLRTGK